MYYIVENLYKNDFAPTARKQFWNMFPDQLKVVRQKIERSCQMQKCNLTSTDSSCNSQSNLMTFRCIYCGTFGVGSSSPKKPFDNKDCTKDSCTEAQGVNK